MLVGKPNDGNQLEEVVVKKTVSWIWCEPDFILSRWIHLGAFCWQWRTL